MAKKTEQEIESMRSVYRENRLKLVFGERRCLGCDKPFKSEGKHNRMCNPCRNYVRSWYPERDYATPS